MLDTIALMGIVISVLGKVVGIVFAARNENATNIPFIVLVAGGYAMFIGAILAGGAVSL